MYPVQWYGIPAIGKKYIDEVFVNGFAFVYGHSSHAKIAGKGFKLIGTLGGSSHHYRDVNILTMVYN